MPKFTHLTFFRFFRQSLFWKVMLLFWVTLISMVVVNTFITKQISKLEITSKNINQQLTRLAEDAVSIYESSGEKSLQRWYQHRYRKDEIRLLLFDANRQPIGHPVRLRKHQKSPTDFFDRHWKDRPLPIKHNIRVKGNMGTRYTLSVLPSPYLWKKGIDPRRYSGIRLLIALLIIGLASFWLTRQIARPARQLQEASLQMAKGNLNTRVPEATTQRKDELGELGRSFNQMASNISNMMGQQKQLLRDISHEIKTPLTRQRLAISLLQDLENNTENALLLNKIENQNIKLAELIDQLLTFNKLNEQPFSFADTPILNLEDSLSIIKEDAQIEAKNRSINITLDISPNLKVKGDAQLLNRCFENILSNAIKYSPAHSNILIQAQSAESKAGSNIQVCICDEGPGIPESSMSDIFTPFYRVDNARAQQTGGHGLGLAIVKKIVDQHQGKIQFTNRKPSGLCVEITLPKAR